MWREDGRDCWAFRVDPFLGEYLGWGYRYVDDTFMRAR